MSQGPLLQDIYVADPSAHVFNDRIYVYPSHDRETDIAFNDKGDQYDMVDYHVISMDRVGGKVTDHGVGLKVEDVKWASKQLWAPDAFQGKDGKFYLCFPARDHDGEYDPRLLVCCFDQSRGEESARPLSLICLVHMHRSSVPARCFGYTTVYVLTCRHFPSRHCRR